MNSVAAVRFDRSTIFSLVLIGCGASLMAVSFVIMANPDTLLSMSRCLQEQQHRMDWLVILPLVVLYIDTCLGGTWHWIRLVPASLIAVGMIAGQVLGFVESWQLAVVLMFAGGDLLAKQWHFQYRRR